MSDAINIFQAETAADIEQAKKLFREYETWIQLDLCFQNFEAELAGLPGNYAMPDGRLFLASANGNIGGCGTFRRLEDGICEMKRVFIREDFRGLGLGKLLIERLIGDAREAGYTTIRLDTFPPKMGKAVSIYTSHGFRPIAPYYNNPHDGVLFMELAL